jgi:hypothetical protein
MTFGREPLSERRAPTHTLVVEVSMHIGDGQTLYVDPIQDALRTVLALSRLATIGVLCGEVQATIKEKS